MKKDPNQKGAIMLELLAVLMLLGALSPMLYSQVVARNEELRNINYAAELRSLKEGFLAYIIANREDLLTVCKNADTTGFTDGSIVDCKLDTNTDELNKLAQYMPDADMPADFIFKLEAGVQSATSSKVVFQGFVYPSADLLPADLTMRRAARIANLIGADGGVYDTSLTAGVDSDGKAVHTVQGALGAWTYVLPDNFFPAGYFTTDRTATYLATTGLDSYSPRAEPIPLDDDSVYVPRDLAFQKLHAWSSFAVGGGEGNTNCYTQTTTAQGTFNTPTGSSGSNPATGHTGSNCDPLFWVGTTDNAVHVKNKLHIGKNSAVVLEGDTAGTTGKITVKGTDGDTLTIENGQIKSDRETPDSTTSTPEHYVLDPSHTSIMNDIRLVSRGNAKLSAILPNYIAKTVDTITDTTNPKTIEKPTCPEYYTRAIIVTPTRWDAGAMNASGTALGFAVEVDNAPNHAPDNTNVGGSWTVKIGYKKSDTANGSFETPTTSSPLAALAQTFCVWDETRKVIKNGDEKTLKEFYPSSERTTTP